MTAIDRKRCTKCLMSKQPEEFKVENYETGRLHGWCKPCYKKYFAEYNKRRDRSTEKERSKEKYNNSIKPRRVDKKRALVALLGGKCSLCGYCKSAAALDFDHLHDGLPYSSDYHNGLKNPDKSRTISHLLALSDPDSFKTAIEEAKKCRLLCSNCHREQTHPGHEMGDGPKCVEEVLESEMKLFAENSRRNGMQKLRLSNSLKESWSQHPEWKSVRQVPVERVDSKTGEITEYQSIVEAVKDGFDGAGVSLAINGKLQSHRGFWWRRSNSGASTRSQTN